MGDHCSTCGQALPPAAGPAWEFSLPLVAPSQNARGAVNKGSGRFQYGPLRLQFQLLLQNQRQVLRIPVARGRRRVSITRSYRATELDPGNLTGGAKMLLDAMVRAGLLVDDREEFVEAHYHQRRGAAAETRIRIEELELTKEASHAR